MPKNLEKKYLSDLDESTAKRYAQAHAMLGGFVSLAMAEGGDPFGAAYFAEMRRIETELSVPEECWAYMDTDDLLLSNWQ